MFSILTTTYNSGHLIHRVYDSLKNQTLRDFEWIISDDGSTDDTQEIIKQWQDESNFRIVFHKMPRNQGKAYALNAGLDLCEKPITINADADDTFAACTLEDLKQIWDNIDKSKEAEKIGAVWTIVKDENGKLIGEPWPKNFWQVSFKERVLQRKRNVAGEKWHSWRTNVLQNNKKFTNPNSRVSPSISWNRINKKYDFLCVNIIHRTYFSNPDGISLQKKSTLKIMKRLYYSAFYELQSASVKNIFRYPYYRHQAFSYVKALRYYRDRETNIGGFKLFVLYIIFILTLPLKFFDFFVNISKK